MNIVATIPGVPPVVFNPVAWAWGLEKGLELAFGKEFGRADVGEEDVGEEAEAAAQADAAASAGAAAAAAAAEAAGSPAGINLGEMGVGPVGGGPAAAQCFRGDVLIWTPTGAVPIRDLKIGDLVWSWDFAAAHDLHSRGRVAQRVRAVTHGMEDHLIHVDACVHVTRLHRFAVGVDQWKRACELVAGDVVCGASSDAPDALRPREIAQIRWTPWIGGQEVYNIAVEAHPLAATFFVGNEATWYLVHNGDGGGNGGGGGGGGPAGMAGGEPGGEATAAGPASSGEAASAADAATGGTTAPK